jgi:phage anti-repressor protein
MSVFPEYNLLPWQFTVSPSNFWSNVESQRKFMNWAAEQLNIKEPSDWYSITQKVMRYSKISFNSKDFEKIGGGHLLFKYYNNSPSSLIMNVFPQYQLLPWKFTASPHNLWTSVDNQRKFMNWVAEQLGIKESSDWYKVANKVTINDYKISTLLGYFANRRRQCAFV